MINRLRFGEFTRADFDFDGLAQSLGALYGRADASRETDVIVLDEHRVPKTHAVIDDSPGGG